MRFRYVPTTSPARIESFWMKWPPKGWSAAKREVRKSQRPRQTKRQPISPR